MIIDDRNLNIHSLKKESWGLTTKNILSQDYHYQITHAEREL